MSRKSNGSHLNISYVAESDEHYKMASNNFGEQNRMLFEGIQFYVETSKDLNEEEADKASQAAQLN